MKIVAESTNKTTSTTENHSLNPLICHSEGQLQQAWLIHWSLTEG